MNLLKQNGIIAEIPEKQEEESVNLLEALIEIADIKVYTVGGESVFYITAVDGQIYSQRLCDEERLIMIKVGDKLKINYHVDTAEENSLIRKISDFSVIIEENAEESSQKDQTE